MKKRIQPFVSFLFFFFLISSSGFAQFKVVAYLPTWMDPATTISNLDLDKLTHINIAFANPNSGGTLIPADGVANSDVTTVVTACHAKGVKVFMSIGGAGAPGSRYSSLLSNTTNMNSFITKIVSYTTTYNLDGIDVDIEGDVLDGSTVTATQYQNFVTALATGLHAQSKEMSAALATWFGDYVTATAASQFDWINIMSYDAAIPPSDPVGQHSPYSMVTDDFTYWNSTKGVPGSKLVIGVPFYGYGWGTYATQYNDEIAYCDIVNQHTGAENSDQVGSGNNVIYYNGIATIEQKTNFALQNASGVMIWEIAEDCSTSDSRSLLLAISQTINSSTTGVSSAQLTNVKLNVYPNPMTDYAFIELDMPHSSNGKLVICDMEGKMIFVVAQGVIEQHAQYTFPMIGFAPGLYLLKLFTDDGVTVRKITK